VATSSEDFVLQHTRPDFTILSSPAITQRCLPGEPRTAWVINKGRATGQIPLGASVGVAQVKWPGVYLIRDAVETHSLAEGITRKYLSKAYFPRYNVKVLKVFKGATLIRC
jgi:hypothetical protein